MIEPRAGADGSGSASGERILIVEDDAAVAADLQGIIQEMGYEVPATLGRAEGALDVARDHGVRLALLDIRLTGSMDGTDLGRLLDAELGIPVVYVTAFGDEETLARIRHSGTAGYILKPFRREELKAVVSLALDAHHFRMRMELSQKRYRILFEQNLAGVLRKSTEGMILECNDAFCRILGYDSPEELEGRSAEILYPSPEDREYFLEQLRSEGAARNLELRMRRKDGTPVWVLDNSSVIEDPGGGRPIVLSTILDISRQKNLEMSLKEMAYHDPLTGLPNRRHLKERAPQILALAERRRGRVGLFFLDLVGFKAVNDTHGHRMGDRVLVEVGRRLQENIRAADTLARVGGDEFAVLLGGADDLKGVRKAAWRLIEWIEKPLEVDGVEIRVSGRSGVAVFPDHAGDFEELLSRADQAVAQAKSQGGSVVVVAPKVEGT